MLKKLSPCYIFKESSTSDPILIISCAKQLSLHRHLTHGALRHKLKEGIG